MWKANFIRMFYQHFILLLETGDEDVLLNVLNFEKFFNTHVITLTKI